MRRVLRWDGLRREGGFTLTEIMLVLLIIGLLIAIALPTYIGFRHRAHDTKALSDLRTGVAAAKLYFHEDETYVGFDDNCAVQCKAQQIEPNLVWIGAGNPPQTPPTVAILVAEKSELLLVRHSESGAYFCVAESTQGTHFGRGDNFGSVNDMDKCENASL